jgi:hypothetical protein
MLDTTWCIAARLLLGQRDGGHYATFRLCLGGMTAGAPLISRSAKKGEISLIEEHGRTCYQMILSIRFAYLT